MGIIHLLVANGTFGLSCYLLCICNLCLCICAFVLVYLHLCICTCVFVLSKQDSWVESFSTHPLGRLCRLKLPLNQSEPNHPLTRMVTVEKGKYITRSASNIRFNGKTGALPPGQYLPFKTSCRSTSTNPSEMSKGAEMQK